MHSSSLKTQGGEYSYLVGRGEPVAEGQKGKKSK